MSVTIDDLYLGVYWRQRPLNLRQFADSVRGFLTLLQELSPLFAELEWVGDRPNSEQNLGANLEHLERIVLKHSWDRRDILGEFHPDGTISWGAMDKIGFRLRFNAMNSFKQDKGRATVSIRAGTPMSRTVDSVVIDFLKVEPQSLPCLSVLNFSVIKSIFLKTIDFWEPERGLVTSSHFSHQLYPDGPPESGWLTYYADINSYAAIDTALLQEFETERLENGTLITLMSKFPSATSIENVAHGIKLRDSLYQMGTKKLSQNQRPSGFVHSDVEPFVASVTSCARRSTDGTDPPTE